MVVVNFISECYLASLVLIVICLLQFSVCTSVIFVHSFPWIGGSTGFLVVRWGKSKNFVHAFWTVLFSFFVEILFSCLDFHAIVLNQILSAYRWEYFMLLGSFLDSFLLLLKPFWFMLCQESMENVLPRIHSQCYAWPAVVSLLVQVRGPFSSCQAF